jgi:hypothetical protein
VRKPPSRFATLGKLLPAGVLTHISLRGKHEHRRSDDITTHAFELTSGGNVIHNVSLAILITLLISPKLISIDFELRLRKENRPPESDEKMTEKLSDVDD